MNYALPLSHSNAPSTGYGPRAQVPRPSESGISLRQGAPRTPGAWAQSSTMIGARPFAPTTSHAPAAKPAPLPAPVPRTMAERMTVARERLRAAGEAGLRVRSYEVALDLDLSEFHFARQFRAAFGQSPHAFYDEVRAERARTLLGDGLPEGDVARRVGLRRPAELRALLTKCVECEATS